MTASLGRRAAAAAGLPVPRPQVRSGAAPGEKPTRTGCEHDPGADGTAWSRAAWSWAARDASVPVVRAPERPGTARRGVATGDVVETPGDLGRRVGLPVGADACHLGTRQRLRDAEGTAREVARIDPPAALAGPQVVQAGPLVGTPASGCHELLADGSRGAGRRRRRHG